MFTLSCPHVSISYYSYVLLAANLFAFTASTRSSMSANSSNSPSLFLTIHVRPASSTHEKIYRSWPPQVTLEVALKNAFVKLWFTRENITKQALIKKNLKPSARQGTRAGMMGKKQRANENLPSL